MAAWYAGPDCADLDIINCNPSIVYELLVTAYGAAWVDWRFPHFRRLVFSRDGPGGVSKAEGPRVG